MKSLVAYFSATGVTKNLAVRIAQFTGSDLYEIEPKIPYTEEDLNWLNPESRSSVEMKNLDFRPAIKLFLRDIEEFDTIFLGFPIWWYIAPTIINTFLESLDFSGKQIIPFATSGGSGMGETNKYLLNSCKGAFLKEGSVLPSNISDDDLINWLNQF